MGEATSIAWYTVDESLFAVSRHGKGPVRFVLTTRRQVES